MLSMLFKMFALCLVYCKEKISSHKEKSLCRGLEETSEIGKFQLFTLFLNYQIIAAITSIMFPIARIK